MKFILIAVVCIPFTMFLKLTFQVLFFLLLFFVVFFNKILLFSQKKMSGCHTIEIAIIQLTEMRKKFPCGCACDGWWYRLMLVW